MPLILVTGATGLVGNNVVRLLAERGDQVRVLQRANSPTKPLAGLPVESVPGDITDAASVERAMAGVNGVVHAAGYVHVGWTNLGLHRAINVEGTRNVASAARAAGVRMVHVSSVDALGLRSREHPADESTPPDPRNQVPYALTKREAEAVVLEEVDHGLDAVIVNPVFMLGPWDWKPSSGRMLLAVAQQRPLFTPRGGNDFCDVRDVAAGILTASERGRRGERYILGGEAMSYFEAWSMFADVVGVRRPIRAVRPFVLKSIGRVGDLIGKLKGRELDVNSAATLMATWPHHYTYAKAAAELGYRPRPARQAAKAAWQWFQEHGYAPKRS
ncbi:MAG: NAD-dependent epimerase/dehydratase family protein [Planctomycetes bacterium]|nr:NAD-dependent epimerase/dehydratase family protein [Planctomycetota bacterium]